jgi:hypothetical protein
LIDVKFKLFILAATHHCSKMNRSMPQSVTLTRTAVKILARQDWIHEEERVVLFIPVPV